MKHTLGPWFIQDERYINSYNRGKKNWAIGEVGMRGCLLSKIDRANAKLIAAAPDLLEACKMAKKYLEPDLIEPGRTVFWKLVEAIKKAESE